MNEKALESLNNFNILLGNYEIAEESINIEPLTKKQKVEALLSGLVIVGALTVNYIMNVRKEKKRKREIEAKKKEESAKNKQWGSEVQEWAEKTGVKFEDRKKVGAKIQTELCNYLKKYANSSELSQYKSQMKEALSISNSVYSDFGVQITEFQCGLPYDDIYDYKKSHPDVKWEDLPKELTDNTWYYKMLDEGEKFVRKTFPREIEFFGFSIDTGDGDEGNIYID